jgi:hypothetical protein
MAPVDARPRRAGWSPCCRVRGAIVMSKTVVGEALLTASKGSDAERLPPNDGGISYGQVAVAAARLAAPA